MKRGRLFTLRQAAEAYSPALTERYLRRLVAEQRIAVVKPGGDRRGSQKVLLWEADLDEFLERSRLEPFRPERVTAHRRSA